PSPLRGGDGQRGGSAVAWSGSGNPAAAASMPRCLRCGLNDATSPGCCRFHPALLSQPGSLTFTPEWMTCQAAGHTDRTRGCLVRSEHFYEPVFHTQQPQRAASARAAAGTGGGGGRGTAGGIAREAGAGAGASTGGAAARLGQVPVRQSAEEGMGMMGAAQSGTATVTAATAGVRRSGGLLSGGLAAAAKAAGAAAAAAMAVRTLAVSPQRSPRRGASAPGDIGGVAAAAGRLKGRMAGGSGTGAAGG
ncbi:hypothetical protein Agub_g5263, partial [Astrephomene gubernaculifera]